MIAGILLKATLASVAVAILTGMLGPFVLWRRMAYIGDAMGHAALLGVVLGLITGLPMPIAVACVALLIGILLASFTGESRLPFDAVLGLVSTSALALGLVLFSLQPNRQIDLFGYLFGDILAASHRDMIWLAGIIFLQAVFIIGNWRSLLRLTVHPEIAQVEGVNVCRLQFLMTVMIAVTVAFSLQTVGMLLVTALLIIPALAARLIAKTPVSMVLLSVVLAMAASVMGVQASFHYDIPTGPAIVVALTAIFTMIVVMQRVRLSR